QLGRPYPRRGADSLRGRRRAAGIQGGRRDGRSPAHPEQATCRRPEHALRYRGGVPPVISLAMITRDESARLAACLASAGPAVDEMVVVDTGSTDDTQALARDEGPRPVEWPW